MPYSLGLPVSHFVVATNSNDILARFFEAGAMTMTDVVPTYSPSMDIQISSNFERLLFDLYGRDGKAGGTGDDADVGLAQEVSLNK